MFRIAPHRELETVRLVAALGMAVLLALGASRCGMEVLP